MAGKRRNRAPGRCAPKRRNHRTCVTSASVHAQGGAGYRARDGDAHVQPPPCGFEQRRRTLGFGRFLTEADIARRPVFEVTDLLRNLPGVRVYRQGFDKVLLVRGGVEDWCVPSVWVDDHYIFNMSGDDVDSWVKPSRVAGIEVYVGISTPAQYQRGLSGCGAIVIWTK